jgi:hypothetical protein
MLVRGECGAMDNVCRDFCDPGGAFVFDYCDYVCQDFCDPGGAFVF